MDLSDESIIYDLNSNKSYRYYGDEIGFLYDVTKCVVKFYIEEDRERFKNILIASMQALRVNDEDAAVLREGQAQVDISIRPSSVYEERAINHEKERMFVTQEPSKRYGAQFVLQYRPVTLNLTKGYPYTVIENPIKIIKNDSI